MFDWHNSQPRARCLPGTTCIRQNRALRLTKKEHLVGSGLHITVVVKGMPSGGGAHSLDIVCQSRGPLLEKVLSVLYHAMVESNQFQSQLRIAGGCRAIGCWADTLSCIHLWWCGHQSHVQQSPLLINAPQPVTTHAVCQTLSQEHLQSG